jgi:hypothetical protein
VAALGLGERLSVEVEVVIGDAASRPMKVLRSSQPGGTGMKSSGEASSTLISSCSLMRGIALRRSSLSGTRWRSTSMVEARQPSRTAVAPPVK